MKGLEEYEIEDDQLDPIYGGVVEQGIEDTIERIIRMKKDEGLNKEAFLAELSSDSLASGKKPKDAGTSYNLHHKIKDNSHHTGIVLFNSSF